MARIDLGEAGGYSLNMGKATTTEDAGGTGNGFYSTRPKSETPKAETKQWAEVSTGAEFENLGFGGAPIKPASEGRTSSMKNAAPLPRPKAKARPGAELAGAEVFLAARPKEGKS